METTDTGPADSQPEVSDNEFTTYFEPGHLGTDDYEFSLEEQYRLALESIVRWTDRSFDTDFRDALIVRAISQVAEVALGIK